MKTIRYITILIITMLLVTTCQEEFLETQPLGEETSENYFELNSNAVSALTAVYSVLNGVESYSRNYWVFADIASDDTEAGGEATCADQPAIQNIDRMIHDADNSVAQNFWGALFQGVYRANVVIEEVPGKVSDNNLAERLVAEARFLRAKYFFDLALVFGEIPLTDHVLSPEEYQMERAPLSDIFALIQADLESAAEVLPEQYSASANDSVSNEGRATKAAAQSLLVKAYIFESSYNELRQAGNDPHDFYTDLDNRWEEARVLAEDIIANAGSHGIGLDPDYQGMWRAANEDSEEFIFKINCASITNYDGEQMATGVQDQFYGVGSVGNVYQKCRSYFGEDGAEENLGGWGFNAPTQDLVDAFDPLDPRGEFTIISDSDEVVGPSGDTVLAWPSSVDHTGYNHMKYFAYPSEYESGAAEHGGPLDYKVIRYADLLLWAAEANFKTGNEPRARELVNMVRERARNSVTPAATEPADYTSPIGMEEIILERRIELACEGHRFFDLVRWGMANQQINGQFNTCLNGAINFQEGKNEYFPIPQSSILQSDFTLTQNRGY